MRLRLFIATMFAVALTMVSPPYQPVNAQTPAPNLEGAFFRYTYQVPADETIFYHYDFVVERGRGRYIPYEDNASRDTMRRMARPMTCRMDGLTCELCCGERGTVGAQPGARHTLTIAPDGRSATYLFVDAQGQSHNAPQTLTRRN